MDTKVRDVNFNILLQLDYQEVINISNIDKHMYTFNHNEYFWQVKYNKDFGKALEKQSWKQLYEYTYLLNLSYDQLIELNHPIVNELFWKNKFHQDFVCFERLQLSSTWQGLYHVTNNTNKNYPSLNYPLLNYPFTTADINHYNPLLILESSNPQDFYDELTENIEGDCWGIVMIKNNKKIPLYNLYHHVNLHHFNDIQCSTCLEKILDSLKVNDAFTIYMLNKSRAWGETLTRTEKGYQLTLSKSYPEPYYT